MTGLNLHTLTIGILLTIVTHVHGSSNNLQEILTNEINQSGDSDVDFHISKDARTWKDSVEQCYKNGGLLANLDNKVEREALILALRLRNDYEGARFWIFTCRAGEGIYCNGKCTEVTYTRKGGLKDRILSGTDCNIKKGYICES